MNYLSHIEFFFYSIHPLRCTEICCNYVFITSEIFGIYCNDQNIPNPLIILMVIIKKKVGFFNDSSTYLHPHLHTLFIKMKSRTSLFFYIFVLKLGYYYLTKLSLCQVINNDPKYTGGKYLLAIFWNFSFSILCATFTITMVIWMRK